MMEMQDILPATYKANTDHDWRIHRPAKPDSTWTKAWVWAHLGMVVPDKAVCPGHRAPFGFLMALLWPSADVLAWACRSGGKTQNAAIASQMGLCQLPGLQQRVLGGSKYQAKQMYAYLEEWNNRRTDGIADFTDLVDDQMNAEGGRFHNRAGIEILTQSTKSARSPHVPVLYCDEVDEFKPEVYQAATKIPKSWGPYTAIMAAMSTMQYSYGLMRTLVDNADKRGFDSFHWCVFEVMARCRDRVCSRCPLSSDCASPPGDDRHPVGQTMCDGYLDIEDVVKIRMRSDDESWIAEMRCKRVTRRGLVYKRFGAKNVQDDVKFDPNLQTFAGLDKGADNPSALVIVQYEDSPRKGPLAYLGRQQRVIHVPLYRPFATAAEFASAARPYWNQYHIQCGFGDPASPDWWEEFTQQGMTVYSADNALMEGIAACKRTIRNGLVMDRERCAPLILEVGRYHTRSRPSPGSLVGAALEFQEDKPVDKDNHGLDAWRYVTFTMEQVYGLEDTQAWEVATQPDLAGELPKVLVTGDGISLAGVNP